MARPSTQIVLTEEQKKNLQENMKPTTQYRFVQRVRAVLLAAEGLNNKEIAREVGLSVVAVSHWRTRFAKYGIDGLRICHDRGSPAPTGMMTG